MLIDKVRFTPAAAGSYRWCAVSSFSTAVAMSAVLRRGSAAASPCTSSVKVTVTALKEPMTAPASGLGPRDAAAGAVAVVAGGASLADADACAGAAAASVIAGGGG